MGKAKVKKRNEAVPQTTIKISDQARQYLRDISAVDVMHKFIGATDLVEQLVHLKLIISKLESTLPENQLGDQINDLDCRPLVFLLIDVYFNLPARNPLKKTLASSLQLLFDKHLEIISDQFRQYVASSINVHSTGESFRLVSNVRDFTDKLAANLDNFPLGEWCLIKNYCAVIRLLTTSLTTFRQQTWSCLSPIDKTKRLSDLLATIQLHNRLLHKVHASQSASCSSSSVWSERQQLSLEFSSLIDCFYEILQEEFVLDCQLAAAMGLVVIVKFLSMKHLLVAQVQKQLLNDVTLDFSIPAISSEDTPPEKDQLPSSSTLEVEEAIDIMSHLDCKFKDPLQLPIKSYICLLSGVLSILDADDLATPLRCLDGTFITDSVAKRLLLLADRLSSVEEKLVYSRTLSTLISKARLALSLGVEFRGHATLSSSLDGRSSVPDQLIQYSWTHWDDPVDVIRYQARIIFEQVVHCHLLATNEEPSSSQFLLLLAERLLNMDWAGRAKYGPLCCLVKLIGAGPLLRSCPRLPQLTLAAMADPSIACHVAELLGRLYTGHLAELSTSSAVPDVDNVGTRVDMWCRTWVEPALSILNDNNASPAHQMQISDFVLRHLIDTCPQTVRYITNKFTNRAFGMNATHLRVLVACHKHLKTTGSHDILDSSDPLLNVDSIRRALCHSDEQVRLDALGLLCEYHKTTAVVPLRDLELVKFFLPLNLDSQSPAFRQSLIATVKKLLMRLNESSKALRRRVVCRAGQNFSASAERETAAMQLEYYKDFLLWFCDMCFEALHPEASFPSRTTSIALLSMFVSVVNVAQMTGESPTGFSFVEMMLNAPGGRLLTLVECLMDTFEQNKSEAFSVLRSVPSHLLKVDENMLKSLFDAALVLAESTRPQDGPTAAFLFRFLLLFPNLSPVMQQHIHSHEGVPSSDDRYHVCLMLLLQHLQRQLDVATVNLLKAAASRPMYPTLLCIRYIMTDLSLSTVGQSSIDQWRHLVTDLIGTCFRVADCVMPVVSNSSPEGNIPDDIAAADFDVGCNTDPESSVATNCCDVDQSSTGDVGSVGNCAVESLVDKQAVGAVARVQLMPEYLVVCGWRSIKEVSLLLGQLTSTLPVIDPETESMETESTRCGVVTVEQLKSIGGYFTRQLLESRHRGAFELAYAGFVRMTEMLWRCPISAVHRLPEMWLNDLMSEVRVHDPTDRLCSTRRSAGVPFYIQALVTTEPASMGRNSFKRVMSEVLLLAQQPTDRENTAQIHALNILRALFRDTRLGEDVFPFIADGMKVAVLGYSATYWPIRNSATLLFSALITRIFGVKRARTSASSADNLMTGRVFFNRFPTLFEFFLEQLSLATDRIEVGSDSSVHLNPGLYPLLIVLARLCPSVAEGSNSSLRIEDLVPFVVRCGASAVYKTRIMAARAIRPLVSAEHVVGILSSLLANLPTDNRNVRHNRVHGSLIQISALLPAVGSLDEKSKCTALRLLTEKLVASYEPCARSNRCFMSRAAFVDVVTAVVYSKWPPSASEHDAKSLELLSTFLQSAEESEVGSMQWQPFVFQHAAQLAKLRLYNSVWVDDNEKTISLLLHLLSSEVSELRLVALQFLSSVFQSNTSEYDGGEFSADDEHNEPTSVAFGQPEMSDHLENFHQRFMVAVTTADSLAVKLLMMLVDAVLWKENNCECIALMMDTLIGCARNSSMRSTSGKAENTSASYKCDSWLIPVAANLLKRLLELVASHPREKVKCTAMRLSAYIFTAFYQLPIEDPDDRVNIELIAREFCSRLETNSISHVSRDMRLACCTVVAGNVHQLLLDPLQLIGSLRYPMWTVLLRLLQDEEPLIRGCAAATLNILAPDQEFLSMNGIQSQLALKLCLGAFVDLHTRNRQWWYGGGVQTVLEWMVTDLDPGWPEQERSVRLFDRGDLNSYKDELGFLLNVASSCAKAQLLELEPIPDFAERSEMEQLRSTFRTVLSEVSPLIARIKTRSIDAAFLPRSQGTCSDDVVSLVRKLVAVCWLHRVLGNSNDFDLSVMLRIMADVKQCVPRHWLEPFFIILKSLGN